MSKAKEIWNKGIGSVHGADVTQRLCYETASNLSAYARELEKEQSDLDWLQGELESLVKFWQEKGNCEFDSGKVTAYCNTLDLIKERREAKS